MIIGLYAHLGQQVCLGCNMATGQQIILGYLKEKYDKWLLDRKVAWDRICLQDSIGLHNEKLMLERRCVWSGA